MHALGCDHRAVVVVAGPLGAAVVHHVEQRLPRHIVKVQVALRTRRVKPRARRPRRPSQATPVARQPAAAAQGRQERTCGSTSPLVIRLRTAEQRTATSSSTVHGSPSLGRIVMPARACRLSGAPQPARSNALEDEAGASCAWSAGGSAEALMKRGVRRRETAAQG